MEFGAVPPKRMHMALGNSKRFDERIPLPDSPSHISTPRNYNRNHSPPRARHDPGGSRSLDEALSSSSAVSLDLRPPSKVERGRRAAPRGETRESSKAREPSIDVRARKPRTDASLLNRSSVLGLSSTSCSQSALGLPQGPRGSILIDRFDDVLILWVSRRPAPSSFTASVVSISLFTVTLMPTFFTSRACPRASARTSTRDKTASGDYSFLVPWSRRSRKVFHHFTRFRGNAKQRSKPRAQRPNGTAGANFPS